MSDSTADYITIEEVAALLDLSSRQASRYGKGEGARLRTRQAGKRILYHRGDVESLARDFQVARTPPPPRESPPTPEASPLLPPLEGRPDPLEVGSLISLAEAAEYAKLERGTIHDYVKKGRLRAKKIGSQWVTTYAAVDEYIESRKV
ncbi:helix-turn-helix domain-containing protein [Chloroflexales bacterium ZM16-3]|nr:helix-turn-helix domain-containing protein [Chloroflexales bacterium ZM16-3]